MTTCLSIHQFQEANYNTHGSTPQLQALIRRRKESWDTRRKMGLSHRRQGLLKQLFSRAHLVFSQIRRA